jgi:bacteriorhodopsin
LIGGPEGPPYKLLFTCFAAFVAFTKFQEFCLSRSKKTSAREQSVVAACVLGPDFTMTSGITIANGSGMNTVAAITPADDYAGLERSLRQFQYVRILRWTFRRDGGDAVVSELALTGQDRQ